MGLFTSAKVSYLGVDIGTASIKVVELKREANRPSLVTYGYIDIATDIIRSNTPETRQKIVNSLKKVCSSARVSTSQAIAALPTFSVFNSIITLPKMSSRDLSSAVKWEAKKYVPLPLEEMILDWKLLKMEGQEIEETPVKAVTPAKPVKRSFSFPFFGRKSAARKGEAPAVFTGAEKRIPETLRILVTAAPKNLVNRYIEVFQQAGLKLISLETEAFALSRALIGVDKTTVMIVDIGSITTDLCVIERGVPILNRSIDVGGLTITQAIAKSLDINLERAEQFKRDFGVSVDEMTNEKGIPKVIVTALSPIINEIKYVLDLYRNQGNLEVEKIILAGGSAFLPNLVGYLTELFNKSVMIGNPWDRVIYPEELKSALDEIGSRLAVAIGLAMRDI